MGQNSVSSRVMSERSMVAEEEEFHRSRIKELEAEIDELRNLVK
jgi:hypothetical protein